MPSSIPLAKTALTNGITGQDGSYLAVLHYGDLTDISNLIRNIQQVQPDEIYNLGAQSHVAVSFEAPEDAARDLEPMVICFVKLLNA